MCVPVLPSMPSLCKSSLYSGDHGPHQSSLSGKCCTTCIAWFFLELNHMYMPSQGLLVAHIATHWGIHSSLSKKLPSLPCLAPELPRKVESCSHYRHVGHAGKGSAQPSPCPPKNIGNPCLPRDKGKHCPPGHLGTFKLPLQLLQACHGESRSCSQV